MLSVLATVKVFFANSVHIGFCLCFSATSVTSLSWVSDDTDTPNLFSTLIRYLEPPQTSTVSATRWCNVVALAGFVVNNNEQIIKNFLTVLVWFMSLRLLSFDVRPRTDLVHKEMKSHRLVFTLFMLAWRLKVVKSNVVSLCCLISVCSMLLIIMPACLSTHS